MVKSSLVAVRWASSACCPLYERFESWWSEGFAHLNERPTSSVAIRLTRRTAPVTCCAGADAVTADDPHPDEDRFVTIRLISARKASPGERRHYEEKHDDA